MKMIVMAVAATLPLAAIAAESGIRIDAAKLRTAIPASALIEQEVMASGEREAGEVEDILISRDGKVRYFLLETDDDVVLDTRPVQNDDTFHDNEPRPETAAASEGRSENLEDRGFEVDDELRAVQPGDISFTDNAGGLLIADNAQLRPVAEDEDRIGGMRISEIIGMEVNLADEQSFGRIEDVMLSSDGSAVVALVVDNWQGLNKHRRALPFDNAIVSYEEEEITFPYTEDRLEDVPDFNLDAYEGDGWF